MRLKRYGAAGLIAVVFATGCATGLVDSNTRIDRCTEQLQVKSRNRILRPAAQRQCIQWDAQKLLKDDGTYVPPRTPPPAAPQPPAVP